MTNWKIVNAVQKMQDFIENNIEEPINLMELAKISGYSLWHAVRIFKELTGTTPFEYIRKLRLSKAAIKLRDNNFKVIEVAFAFVFDTHEGFTRAFSKNFGITPSYYSKHKPPIKLFMPHPVKSYYLLMSKKGDDNMETKNSNANSVFVQVVERPARKVILKRGVKATHYFEYCEEVGCEVWGVLSSVKEALYEPVGMWLPEKLRPKGTSEYVQGVEVPCDYNNEIAEGFEIVELEPCKMMVFQGQPYEEEDMEEVITNMWKMMKNYDPKLYGFKWADHEAPRFQLIPLGSRGYIEAKPVKEIERK